MSDFSDPTQVAHYAEGPARLVPGFHDLQRMAAILLAERAGADARILVLGAGGGLELRAFADWHPGWRFTGVDPSTEMLAQAATVTQSAAARIDLHQGYASDAPPGPFDGATCLLTLHFVPVDQRVATLTALRQRLRPGAPLVVAHHSIPEGDAERARWLGRYADFAATSGVPADKAKRAAAAIAERLPITAPDADAAAMRAAGFTDVALFYAAFTFRGWVGYAG